MSGVKSGPVVAKPCSLRSRIKACKAKSAEKAEEKRRRKKLEGEGTKGAHQMNSHAGDDDHSMIDEFADVALTNDQAPSSDAEFLNQLDNMKSWFATMSVDKRIEVYKTLLNTGSRSFEDSIKEAAGLLNLADSRARVDFIKLMPTDIGLKIFSFLDHRALLKVACVSRTWSSLAVNDNLWKRLCWQHINKKCKVCGLGLPMAAVVTEPIEKRKLVWKTVFQERLALEMNWRKGKAHQTILPVGSPVTSLIATNRMIVSGHADGQARVFCVRTLQLHRTVTMHTEPITCLSEDEKRIVSGAMDGTVKIWCASTFKHVRTIPTQSRGVTSVKMSPKWLVAGGVEGLITVWSLTTGAVFMLKGHGDRVTGLELIGKGLMSVSEDGTIRTWNLETQTPLACIDDHKGAITGLTMVKCLFATSSRDKTIKVWKPKENGELTLVHTSFGHESPVESIKVDHLRIVSGSSDRTIKVFDTTDGNMLYSLRGHGAPVDCISSKDSYIVSGDRSGSLIHWNFAC